MNKHFLLLTVLVLSTIAARSQNELNSPAAVAYAFIKAASTNDTALFYTCIDATALKENADKKWGSSREIGIKELHVLPFFLYGPWKILPENMIKLRKNFDNTCSYMMKCRETRDGLKEVYVEWGEGKTAYLYLAYINNKWKVIDMHR